MNFNIQLNSKQIFTLMFTIFLTFTGITILGNIGFSIPTLFVQCIGFVYLTFLPGFLILRILRINISRSLEVIVYSLGLSLSFLMLLGFLMNILYPILGISHPLSPYLFSITTIIVNLVLLLIAYFLNINSKVAQIKINISKSTLIILLIPFLSIVATYLVNFYEIYLIMFILIIIISIFPLLIVFFNWPKKELYPLLIFSLSLSLLFHWSLISMYLTGADIHYEYYFSSLVKNNSFWYSQLSSNINAMLSIVIIAPIYSDLLNLNLISVFKVIYPFIYAFVPLTLYHVFQKQMNKNLAFLSVFYFISINPFYAEMVQLARQEIAELFLVLLILLMIDKEINNIKKSIMVVIFAFSLVISHYGLSYIYLLLLIFVMLLLLISSKISWSNFRFNRKKQININKNQIITLNFVILFLVLVVAWYSYVSNGYNFSTIINIGNNIVTSISNDFLNSQDVQTISMLNHDYSPLHSITKYLYVISQFCIMVGLLGMLLKPIKTSYTKHFTKEFKLFSIASIVVLLLSVVLPYFASSLNTTRLYHIALFFLAPYAVIGFITIFKIINDKIFKRNFISMKVICGFLATFLMIFFLFNSGLIYEIAKDEPTSIALDKKTDFPMYDAGEMNSAQWILKSGNDTRVYADMYGKPFLNEFLPPNQVFILQNHIIDHQYMVYLRTINIEQNQIEVANQKNSLLNINYVNLTDITTGMNKIYSNDYSDVYIK